MLTVDVIADSFNNLKEKRRISVPLEDLDLQFFLEDALKACNMKYSKVLEGRKNKKIVYILDKV
ncbi:hypothetical protein MHB45_27210 [Peribacillus sp. FSL K6-5616]|uniref:hypothetical protein n=1 Tax=Peribacillus TaxID=2675229 RepID=UPI0030FB2E5C